MKPRVLVVEDDRKIAELVATNLAPAGFDCQLVHDGDRALESLRAALPDLIVLDIMLPGINGLELTRRVRAQSRVPILMLTARSGEADKVLGLELGADDYLTKPFSMAELVARVRALLRRTQAPDQAAPLVRGELAIDPAARTVTRSGQAIDLTTLEFDLLYALALRPGHVLTRDALMHQVWGDDRFVDQRSIDSIVSRMRKKVEADPSAPRYIQTVWGAGYRFSPP